VWRDAIGAGDRGIRMSEGRKRVNPALLGFIAGTEGQSEAKRSEKWAVEMAEKHGVDATTIILYAKTYGFKQVEEALEKRRKQLT